MGFDDHLGKPIRPLDLLAAIDGAIRGETGRCAEAARS
jgi:DNA-binding response OmpR family regulator